ncbi:hypothetical protein PsYK624_111680 [Phanerochaete sordida]|uniref:Uncharacterized protein n=1 Tax=Phanerochaete sordida TaxID=48140 RepID=A0A9P3LH55_9APHY|nr:hypothetical protein PsYK624_111680 [Phanerochaete sordida]
MRRDGCCRADRDYSNRYVADGDPPGLYKCGRGSREAEDGAGAPHDDLPDDKATPKYVSFVREIMPVLGPVPGLDEMRRSMLRKLLLHARSRSMHDVSQRLNDMLVVDNSIDITYSIRHSSVNRHLGCKLKSRIKS